jgi:hypothetical protein
LFALTFKTRAILNRLGGIKAGNTPLKGYYNGRENRRRRELCARLDARLAIVRDRHQRITDAYIAARRALTALES